MMRIASEENLQKKRRNKAIIKFKKLYIYFGLAKRFFYQKTPPGIMFFNQLKTQDVLNKIIGLVCKQGLIYIEKYNKKI